MFFLYILQSCKNGRYYVGSTDNVERRLGRHNAGKVKSTKAYLPWRVVHTETFVGRSEAYGRELQIKSWKKRLMIEKLIGAVV